MIDLPNSFERYLASLRIFVSLSILKQGLKPQHLENLKKIFQAESFYYKNTLQCVDINKLCNNLLGAVSKIQTDFSFFCNVSENYIVNKKLFTCVLLTAAKGGSVKIISSGEFILVFFFGENRTISPFITALGGILLRESKTDYSLAVIPATPTVQESVYVESEWEYLFDKFSVVNLFFTK